MKYLLNYCCAFVDCPLIKCHWSDFSSLFGKCETLTSTRTCLLWITNKESGDTRYTKTRSVFLYPSDIGFFYVPARFIFDLLKYPAYVCTSVSIRVARLRAMKMFALINETIRSLFRQSDPFRRTSARHAATVAASITRRSIVTHDLSARRVGEFFSEQLDTGLKLPDFLRQQWRAKTSTNPEECRVV